MIVIPFANPLGPQSGAAGDGVIFGSLPRAPAVSVLEQSSVIAASVVLRGDSVSGALTYTDVTASAAKVFANNTDPTVDEILVALPASGVVEAVLLEVTRAGTGAGTWAVTVDYDDHTSDVSVALSGTAPTLQALGSARVQLATPLDVTSVPLKRVSGERQRWLRLRLSGVTTVTIAPEINAVRLDMVAPSHVDFTALYGQGASPTFAGRQSLVSPVTGDMLLFGFDEIPLRLFPSVLRPAAEASREWVYSRAGGVFAALPAANFSDPTTRLTGNYDTGNATRSYVGNDVVVTYRSTGAAQNFEVPAGVTGVRVLVVGAGGAGGGGVSGVNYGAGGAGGTVRAAASQAVTPGQTIAVTVGAGGTKTTNVGSAGASSSFGALVVATGGAGADTSRTGGLNADFAGEVGVGGTDGGGGAGAGEAGGTDSAGQGGDGVSSDITGAATFFGGGGGGIEGGAGAVGGDGGGSAGSTGASANASANTGGGGGGSAVNQAGGGGGSGIVIVRWTQVPVISQIPIVPPADIARTTIATFDRYWLALRSTADAAAAILPENATLQAQVVRAAGSVGIPAPETETYTQAAVVARDPALDDSTLIVVNATTGERAAVVLAAGASIATAAISLAVTRGDQLVVVQPLGHPTVNLGDGAIYLS